jgi:hypothetical protein
MSRIVIPGRREAANPESRSDCRTKTIEIPDQSAVRTVRNDTTYSAACAAGFFGGKRP